MKIRVWFILAGCFVISGLVVSVANAGSFTIDDSAEGVSTYWGGLIDWRSSNTPSNGLLPSQHDILGGADDYSVESLKISTTATSLTAVLTGSFFSFTTSAENTASTHPIYSGDLFLSTNGWNPSPSLNGHYNGDNFFTGGDSWEYVLSMDGANTGTYGAINLYESTGTIIFPENVLPNPGSYRTGQEYQYQKETNQSSLGTGTWRISNNTLTFSLSNVTLADYNLDGALGVHWGMTCGNDVVEGFGTPVPEPTTMLLFGAGILGLAGLRRKK